MQEEQAQSSHAAGDDLESQWAAAVEESPDLVASLVHVSRDDQLPPSPSTSVRTVSPPTQQEQLLLQQQHVVPHVDKQHHFQISQITKAPALKTLAIASIPSSKGSPALDHARLTEPFSPDYPPRDFESEGRSLVPIDQCKTLSEHRHLLNVWAD
jgi:hypothetical protein